MFKKTKDRKKNKIIIGNASHRYKPYLNPEISKE